MPLLGFFSRFARDARTTLEVSVENFRAGLDKPASDAHCDGFYDIQFHTDTDVDGHTLLLSGDAASQYGERSTKGKGIVDPADDTEVIEF